MRALPWLAAALALAWIAIAAQLAALAVGRYGVDQDASGRPGRGSLRGFLRGGARLVQGEHGTKAASEALEAR